ncbi:MAG: substrate-binding domain-containing protein [bacterium]|nr:substrate-binding domain-containing protein [bacterium]
MKQNHKKHPLETTLVILLFVFVAITLSCMLLFRKALTNSIVTNSYQSNRVKSHYVFIGNDYTNPFMEQLYQGIRASAEKKEVSVEYFGRTLSQSYTVAQLIDTASKAKVDGIFVVGDESGEVKEAINRAVEANIPVITVFQDCGMSKRQCFVGVNSYDLGRQYAKKLCSLGEKSNKNVYLLINAAQENSGKNSVYLGMKEYLEKEGITGRIQLHDLAIQSKTEFTSDELIRELILDKSKNPDIIICLNSIDTTCAYQAIVDYNKVGQIQILGWGNTDSILTALDKELISATIFTDAALIGSQCIQSMLEYKREGYVSQYIPITTTTIDSTNIKEYLGDERR